MVSLSARCNLYCINLHRARARVPLKRVPRRQTPARFRSHFYNFYVFPNITLLSNLVFDVPPPFADVLADGSPLTCVNNASDTNAPAQ
jgi:hypothetical protein